MNPRYPINLRHVLGRTAVASLLVGAVGLVFARTSVARFVHALAPASAPLAPVAALRYAPGTTYHYEVASNCGFAMAYQNSSGMQKDDTQHTRITGTFRLDVASVSGQGAELQATLVNPRLYKWENNQWDDDQGDYTFLTQPFVIEQNANGEVLACRFQPAGGLSAAQLELREESQNMLKGLAAMIDFRLLTAAGASAQDAGGTYLADFTRVGDTTVKRVKRRYLSLASSTGLSEVNSDGSTQSLASTFSQTGEGTFALRPEDGVIQSATFKENLGLTTPAGPLSTDTSNFTMAGSGVQEGSLALAQVTSTPAGALHVQTLTERQSLHATHCCAQKSTLTSDLSQADRDVASAVQELATQAPRPLHALMLGKALREGGSRMPLHAFLEGNPAEDRLAAVATALGAMGDTESQRMLHSMLVRPDLSAGLKGRVLFSLMETPNLDRPLLQAVEALSEGRQAPLNRQALLVLAFHGRQLAQDGRLDNLVTRLEAEVVFAEDDGTRLACMDALAATGTPQAASILLRLSQDREVDTRRMATCALDSLRDPRALTRLGALLQGDPDAEVRALAAKSLQKAVLKSAPEVLASVINEPGLKENLWESFASNHGFTPADTATHDVWGLSVGGSWVGAQLWEGAAAGYRPNITALHLMGGLDAYILGIRIPFATLTAWARHNRVGASSYRGLMRWTFGASNAAWDWSASTPGSDCQNQECTTQFGEKTKTLEFCGRVSVFKVCFEVGVGVRYGIKRTYSSPTDLNNQHFRLAPFAQADAYAQGSVSLLCLKLSVKLKGVFLNVTFPATLDAQIADPAKVNACLNVAQEFTPWTVALTATLKYCIGSVTIPIWSDTSGTSTHRLMPTWCIRPADLVVSSLSWSPSGIIDTATTTTFSIGVSNQGVDATPPGTPIKVGLYANGSRIGSTTVAPLPATPGANTAMATIPWVQPIAGLMNLEARVDDGDDIGEVVEDNNTRGATLEVKRALPDLRVDTLTAPLVAGDQRQVEFTVLNQGPGDVPNYTSYNDMMERLERSYLPALTYSVFTGSTKLASGLVYDQEAPAGELTPRSWAVRVLVPAKVNGVAYSGLRVELNNPVDFEEKDHSNNALTIVFNGPTITTQPQGRTVSVGSKATFTVVATGSGTLSYQWLKNGSPLSGATAASYTTPATVLGDNGAKFSVNVAQTVGTTTYTTPSSAAVLTVTGTPVDTRPDLSIAKVYLSNPAPAVGSLVDVKVDVQNARYATPAGAQVKVSITANNVLLGTFVVKDAQNQPRTMAAGETYTGLSSVKWKAVAGTTTFVATVDPDKGINETDENNNTGTFRVMPPPVQATGRGKLLAGYGLKPGTEILSNNGAYRLAMQTDGNLVLYQGPQNDKPVWDSKTYGKPALGLYMQTDGNLVIYDKNGLPTWSTSTHGNPGAWAFIQDDANFVVYTKATVPLWAIWGL